MSDLKSVDDFATGQRHSSFDRDMRMAAELGAKAANFEMRPGMQAGSGMVRYTFRKGILDRYRVTSGMGDYEIDYVRGQRVALNKAYYYQPDIIKMISAEPEVKGAEPDPFELPTGEVIDSSFELEMPPATAELLTVMADGMRSAALAA